MSSRKANIGLAAALGRRLLKGGRGALLATVTIGLVIWRLADVSASASGVIPAPAADAPRTGTSETVILAGGCFWGVQGVFQHVKGVSSAVSGYSGGTAETAHYETLSSGRTGHAEAVKVTFDPQQVSYGQILQIYFSVAHDPTELNRQGPDFGPQYRSAIFAADPTQIEVAQAYMTQLSQARVFPNPIVTTVNLATAFYPAEPYHQDFLTLNPHYPYIVINDMPKITDLKKQFPGLYRDTPVLVGKTGI
jgi:peptide-methionine (S)-S-oxide reductase